MSTWRGGGLLTVLVSTGVAKDLQPVLNCGLIIKTFWTPGSPLFISEEAQWVRLFCLIFILQVTQPDSRSGLKFNFM